jgi:Ca2+-binding EF-hand superfamily protein
MTSMRKRMTEKMFKEADSNGDGKISKDEFIKQAEKMKANAPSQGASSSSSTDKSSAMPDPSKLFDQADADGDGSLSEDELQVVER